MLTLWGRRNSFNVQKTLWLLDEIGLDYRHVPAGGGFGRLGELRDRGLNPHGRVPVLEDDGLPVWESHAILRYLAARYGAGAFWPDDPAERARIDGWMDWAQTALQPAFLNGVFWGFYRTPEEQRDWPAINASVARCAELFGLMDEALASAPFLAGDRLTLADVAAGAALFRYYELEIDRPRLPHVEAWRDRLYERPAYRANVMLPFDELRGRLDF
ncbi:glutathione S-transferase family protein [Methylopila henanensis]|uniref:Glutathione S-transferase family protein n=1 Tax=Methylopila henanensis TaxID=873516 RepID=A0ABW4K992_9HYPH